MFTVVLSYAHSLSEGIDPLIKYRVVDGIRKDALCSNMQLLDSMKNARSG